MTRFQKSIIFKGVCVAERTYLTEHNGKLHLCKKGEVFEYVILDTEGYEFPSIFNTHRVLIKDYWFPLMEVGFNMHFIDMSKWREKQIDLILED